MRRRCRHFHAAIVAEDKSMLKFEVFKYADISTCHLAKHDSDLLEQAADNGRPLFSRGPIVYDYDEGFFVWVPSDDLAEFLADYKAFGLSDAFLRIIGDASLQGVHFVRFDVDGAEVRDAKKFDW